MAPHPSPPISSACSWHSCPDIPKSISDDPRIQALLKCNGPLLETDRVSLRATVSESSELLSVLKKKIDRVQQTLNTLLDGQAKVTENLRAAKTLLHPIRSIPDDMLRHIFSFCIHGVYDLLEEEDAPDSLDSRKPPWTLSQVCRSWRIVALSTASLWKGLSIDFEQYREPKDVHLHRFMLGLHIQRAYRCQLTIRLSSINDVSSHAFIPILLTSITYWKHLRACIPAKSLAALSTYGSYLESLHYLAMKLPEDAKSPIRTFEMAQSLRILEIEPTLCRHIYLPDGGKTLTELVIRGPFVEHIFSFLRKTPNIGKLEVYFEDSKPFERLSSPIMMPKLTNLVISEWDGAAPSSIAHLFESLELPALFYLHFSLDNEDSDSTVFVFPEILPHHRRYEIPQLRVIAPRSTVGKGGLVDMLSRVTNMEHLGVEAKIVDEHLLSALTRSSDNDDILPRLRTFDLRCSRSIPDHKMLLQMVESRRKNQTEGGEQEEGIMLEEVYLDEPLTFDDPSLASRWQSLQRNGLIVKYED